MRKQVLMILLLVSLFLLMGCENTENLGSDVVSVIKEESAETQVAKEINSKEDVTSPSTQKVVAIYQTKEVPNDAIDIVVGDDHYATQLADMTLNFDNYEGKVIQIEGMSLKNNAWTFVGRYAENAICPTCPAGYAYYEYEWHGDEKLDFGDEQSWIQVTGKLTRGNDNGEEYYYIDAYEIALMNQFGDVVTVVN